MRIPVTLYCRKKSIVHLIYTHPAIFSCLCMQNKLDSCSKTVANKGLLFNIDKCVAIAFCKFIGNSSYEDFVIYNNVLW